MRSFPLKIFVGDVKGVIYRMAKNKKKTNWKSKLEYFYEKLKYIKMTNFPDFFLIYLIPTINN